NKVYPDGKQYINTGTWTKMVNMDWRGLGQQGRRTFAIIHLRDGKARCELPQWMGHHSPHALLDVQGGWALGAGPLKRVTAATGSRSTPSGCRRTPRSRRSRGRAPSACSSRWT